MSLTESELMEAKLYEPADCQYTYEPEAHLMDKPKHHVRARVIAYVGMTETRAKTLEQAKKYGFMGTPGWRPIPGFKRKRCRL